MASFPTSLVTYTNPTATDKLNSPAHATQHTSENNEIIAIETYLGTNASQTTPVAAGKVLNSTSASATTWTATPTLGVAGTTLGSITLAGNTSGSTVVQPTAAASGTLTLPAATDTLVGKATTDTLTNKTLTSPTLTTPVLGTPSSGTLTNCSGLPVSGITASTVTAIGVGSVELGHATDTTLSRASAGVLAVEGVNVVDVSSAQTLTNKTLTTPIISSISNSGTITLPTGTDTLVAKATTDTLTNKWVQPRVQSVTDAATITPSGTADDMVVITAIAQAFTLANPSGTAVQGQKLIIRIKDNGTGRAITFGTQYRAMGTALPTTTVASKTKYLGLIFNSTDTKWDLVAAADEA